MNFGDFFVGLMNAGSWIETYVINGFMGGGFRAILTSFLTFKPLIDFFVTLLSLFGAA